MNLWVSMEDEGASTSTEEAFHRSLAPLAKHIEGVEGVKPSYIPYEPMRFRRPGTGSPGRRDRRIQLYFWHPLQTSVG
jgi:hypothetical protein